MPGLLLSFVLRFDNHKQKTSATYNEESKIKYFHCSLIGYLVGELKVYMFKTVQYLTNCYASKLSHVILSQYL